MRIFLFFVLCFGQVATDEAYKIRSEVVSKAKLLGTVDISKHESVDVGTMYLGDHREGKVSLKNDTDQPIEITGMSTADAPLRTPWKAS